VMPNAADGADAVEVWNRWIVVAQFWLVLAAAIGFGQGCVVATEHGLGGSAVAVMFISATSASKGEWHFEKGAWVVFIMVVYVEDRVAKENMCPTNVTCRETCT
jgi:MFS superfamily sulfate permease-like transporter